MRRAINKFPLISFIAAALLALASVDAAAQAPSTGVAAHATLAELQQSRWIADGRDDAPRKVYVFLDANCVYCAKFWADARPWVDAGKVQLRYLMVAVIAPTSAGKAATLLANPDPDPARRLAAYERAHAFAVARMLQGGPHHSMQDASLRPAAVVPEPVECGLDANKGFMITLGLRGTPGLVTQAPDGRVRPKRVRDRATMSPCPVATSPCIST